MKILYSGWRDPNHSKFGGYDYITKNPGTYYLDADKQLFRFIKLGQRGTRIKLYWLDIFTRLISRKYDVIHYFYFDCMMFRKIKKNQNSKFVATIHLMVDKLNQIDILKSFDGVICLSSSEEKKLEVLGIKSKFIPHGFNKPIYKNDEIFLKENIQKEKCNVFYSGTNYRDFDTFVEIVEFCYKEKLKIHFHVIGQRKNQKSILKEFANVTVYPFIDDDKYFSLLSACDYSFLPLTFATANNSLLEAQALGIISILPKINGILDYAEPQNNIFYSNIDQLKQIFHELKKNSFNHDIQNFSTKYYWDNIYRNLAEYYNNLWK